MKQNPSCKADSHSTSQKFPVIYGTGRFITVFTRSRHCPLSWIR